MYTSHLRKPLSVARPRPLWVANSLIAAGQHLHCNMEIQVPWIRINLWVIHLKSRFHSNYFKLSEIYRIEINPSSSHISTHIAEYAKPSSLIIILIILRILIIIISIDGSCWHTFIEFTSLHEIADLFGAWAAVSLSVHIHRPDPSTFVLICCGQTTNITFGICHRLVWSWGWLPFVVGVERTLWSLSTFPIGDISVGRSVGWSLRSTVCLSVSISINIYSYAKGALPFVPDTHTWTRTASAA